MYINNGNKQNKTNIYMVMIRNVVTDLVGGPDDLRLDHHVGFSNGGHESRRRSCSRGAEIRI